MIVNDELNAATGVRTVTTITDTTVTVEVDGVVVETRPPTEAEMAALTPPADPLAALMAQLPAATLEETNDILAEVLALLGGT